MELANLYTGKELAAKLLPHESSWSLDHVAAALENLTEWYVERGEKSVLDAAAVAEEVRQMNMSMSLREGIIQQIERVPFTCEWTLPSFNFGARGFAVL